MTSFAAIISQCLAVLTALLSHFLPFANAQPDQDLLRHGGAIEAAGIVVTEHRIAVEGITFRFEILQAAGGREAGPVFVVLHDNENEAFDVALAGLIAHGGRMIVLETAEKRRHFGIDPNRIFGLEKAEAFTHFIRAQLDPRRPIIALHNNRDGYGSGRGTISMRRWRDPAGKIVGFDHGDDEDNFIWMSGKRSASDNVRFTALRDAMEPQGINLVYERAKAPGDYSMSVWAADQGYSYFNIEAEHGNAKRQAEMLGALMRFLMPPRVS